MYALRLTEAIIAVLKDVVGQVLHPTDIAVASAYILYL